MPSIKSSYNRHVWKIIMMYRLFGKAQTSDRSPIDKDKVMELMKKIRLKDMAKPGCYACNSTGIRGYRNNGPVPCTCINRFVKTTLEFLEIENKHRERLQV